MHRRQEARRRRSHHILGHYRHPHHHSNHSIFARGRRIQLRPHYTAVQTVKRLRSHFGHQVRRHVTIQHLRHVSTHRMQVLHLRRTLGHVTFTTLTTVRTRRPIRTTIRFSSVITTNLVIRHISILHSRPTSLPHTLRANRHLIHHIKANCTRPQPAGRHPHPMAPTHFKYNRGLLVRRQLPPATRTLIITVIQGTQQHTSTNANRGHRQLINRRLLGSIRLFTSKTIRRIRRSK